MELFKQWINAAYDKEGKTNNKHWKQYMPKEQKAYETILENKTDKISGTVKEIGQTYDMSPVFACGFIDGIKDIASEEIDMGTMEEDTVVNIDIDFEKLYKKMVEYKAEHLYNLEQWKNIFSEDRLNELRTEQRMSKTFVREGEKIGRNDPCPCGSGKKYKKCCGR